MAEQGWLRQEFESAREQASEIPKWLGGSGEKMARLEAENRELREALAGRDLAWVEALYAVPTEVRRNGNFWSAWIEERARAALGEQKEASGE